MTALILVDPPVGDSVLDTHGNKRSWPNKPYGAGYVDPTPWDSELARSGRQADSVGPPRTSALDDVAFYWTNVANPQQIAAAQKDVSLSSTYFKKIVASQWTLLLEFIWAKLGEFEKELGANGGKRLNFLAETLADVNLFRRRLSWYYDEVEMCLHSMSVAIDERQSDEEGKELISVLFRLRACKEKIESLTPIVTGLLSIRQADLSMREAMLVSKLTLVALVFIPLSFTASIFSMGGDFLPGASMFWVYFAVAVPVTLVILGLAWWIRGETTFI